MNNIVEIKHPIQKHILDVLMNQRTARFRDMRPLRTDTNLYSYHLSQLVKDGLLKKTDEGYTLDALGLKYAVIHGDEIVSSDHQPTIITMLVIQNSNGDILLQRRNKQPYIDAWTLPTGSIQSDDESVVVAAQREANEKLGLSHQPLRHAGDCYIRVTHNGMLISKTLVHVFAFNRDNISTSERILWARPHKLSQFNLAPAVEQIVARTFFRDPFYFEEFDEAW